MRLDKITLMEVAAGGGPTGGRSALAGLATPILAGLAESLGIDARVLPGALTPEGVRRIRSSDLLCLSATTPAAAGAYGLAAWARRRGVPVLLGGSHPSARPREALAHADWVLLGAGEGPFLSLVEALGADEDLHGVAGLGHRQDGEMVFSDGSKAPAARPSSAAEPRLLDRGWGVAPPQRVVPIMVAAWAAGSIEPRYLPAEIVLEHIARARARGAGRIAFVDEDLAASPPRLEDLLDRLQSVGGGLPPWSAQVSLRACCDGGLLRRMGSAGCDGLHLECRPAVDRAIDSKRPGVDVDELRASLSVAAGQGLPVAVTLHVGADGDEPSTIRRLAVAVAEAKVREARFLVSTPYPGAALHRALQRQGRMLTEDWACFDGDHVVFEPARMSAGELLDETARARSTVHPLHRALGRALRGGLSRAARRLPGARRSITATETSLPRA